MYSPALSIGYSLWLRLRWGAGSVLVLLLMLAAMIQLFPSTAEFGCMLALILGFAALIPLLNTFTFGPADLGVRASGFPRHMMVLPMSNRALVGWPMLYAAVTNGILWAMLAGLIFIPAGNIVPILWPMAVLTATCAWMQAIGWMPFPSPFARVPALVLAMLPLMLAIVISLGTESTISTVFVVACSLLWTLAAFAIGAHGVASARRGNEADWFHNFIQRRVARIGSRVAATKHDKPPLRTAFGAQLWYECRRNALMLPLVLSFAAVPMVPVVCMGILNPENVGLRFGSVQIAPAHLALAIWFGCPLLLCGVFGGDMAKCDIFGKSAMTSFFAVRPITTAQFIAIKFTSVLVSVAVTWAIVILAFSIFIVLEMSSLNPRESMMRAAWANASAGRIAIVGGVLIGYLALMWRNIVIGMWPALTGRKKLFNTFVFAAMAEFMLLGAAGYYVHQHPEIQPRLLTLVPWLACIAAILKLGAAARVIAVLRRERLIEPRVLRTLLGLWIAVCAFLLVLLGLGGYLKPLSAVGIILFVPLSRLLAAPLALHWNRHR